MERVFGMMGACMLCADASAAAVCAPCARGLALIKTACPRCARPMPFDEVCGRCIRKPPAFDAAVAVFAYQYPLDVVLTRAKFGADFAALRFLSEALAATLTQAAASLTIDALAPVPLAAVRQAERGYNQAAELAKIPTAQLGVPLLRDLIRTRETEKQTELNFKARLTNMRGAFSAQTLGRPLAGKHIVLIDDVMTTGATLNEAAKALKEAGVARVTVAVVGRAISRKVAP